VTLRSPEPLRFEVEPVYLVITSAGQFCEAFGTTDPPAGIDWRREFLLVAQRGECPTGGYTVTIKTVSLSAPGELTVEVVQSDPAPDDFVTMIVTYPRDAVAVPRHGLERVRRVIFVSPAGTVLGTAEVSIGEDGVEVTP